MFMEVDVSVNQLPSIPFLRIPLGREPAVVALEHHPHRLAALIASARRTYTPAGMHVADRLSLRWARDTVSPYAGIVHSVAQGVGRTGAYLMNYSYEWGCTAGAVDDDALGGPTLLRTLDWPFDGLGRNLVATEWDGGAGRYVSLCWPGFVGVLTGCAPGRFAASINQPPLPAPGFGRAVGWPLARLNVARSRAIPADHLLRLAFDTARDFDEAVALILTTPICLPAIFTIVGVRPGERLVMERTREEAFIPAAPAAANHWASPDLRGTPRNRSSHARRAAMLGLMREAPDWSMGWAAAPILEADTRLAVMANPRTGKLLARGYEKDGPATALLAA